MNTEQSPDPPPHTPAPIPPPQAVPQPSAVPPVSPVPEPSPVPPPSAVPDASPVPAPSPVPPGPPQSARQPQRPADAARCHRGLRPPVPAIWPHLSRPELLRRWLGETDIEIAVGGDFALKAWNGDVVRGRVLRADPPSVLGFTWRPHGTGPESRVEIRLQHDGPGSRVVVRHEQLSSEPERRQARRLWKDALLALRRAVQEGVDAHEWGATLPIAVRMPLARKAGDLWPLLSTPSGIEKWLARVERFDGVAEGGFRFASRAQGLAVTEEGTIDAVAPESRIVFSWEWAGESWGARTKVEMLLEAEPSGTALLILHSGFDKIPAEAAGIARRHYAAAWPKAAADLRRLVAPVVA